MPRLALRGRTDRGETKTSLITVFALRSSQQETNLCGHYTTSQNVVETKGSTQEALRKDFLEEVAFELAL